MSRPVSPRVVVIVAVILAAFAIARADDPAPAGGAGSGSGLVTIPVPVIVPAPARPAAPHRQSTPPPAAPTSHHTSQSTWVAIKAIGGIVGLLVLAYLGGHRRVVRFQEQLGISGVITAGFPFVFLGAIAALPSVGVLTPDVLDNFSGILHFGLGWLGFLIGAPPHLPLLDP